MEEKNYKFGTTLTVILMFSALCSFCGCSPQTGIRSGQVLNAVNNEPIQGAVVHFDWIFSGVLGEGPSAGKNYETLTDKDGKYYVPNQTINKPNFMYGSLEERLLVYKDGYEAYIIDPSRSDSPITKPTDNTVKLQPWKEGWSHDGHMNVINAYTIYNGKGELLKKELEPEKKRADKDLLKDVEAERKRAEQERAKEQLLK
jgi:hypothetical protein